MKIENLRRLTAVAALALAYAGVSAAASISYNTSFGPNSTDFTNGVLSLPEFNNLTGPLAGDVLTGVTLTLAASDDISTLSLSNISGAPQTFSVKGTVDIDTDGIDSLSPPPAGTSVDSSDEITLNTIHLFNTGTIVLGPTGLGACPEGTPSGTCSSVAYTPPDVIGTATGSINSTCVSCYIGSGNFTETAETDTGTTFSNAGGNINLSQVTTADVFATVTYTYSIPSSTPEPATLFLMGSALVGVGLLRKRAKKA